MVRLSKKRPEEDKTPKSIPLPGEVMSKQVIAARGPRRAFKRIPSPLSAEAAIYEPRSGLVPDFEEMEADPDVKKPRAPLFTSIEEMEKFRNLLNDIDSGKIPKDNTYIAGINARWETAMSSTVDSGKTSQEKTVRFAAPVVTGLRYFEAEDEEDGSEMGVTDFTMEDPDDIEMDDEESEEFFEGDPPTLHLPDLPVSNPGSEEKPERQTKRKRESEISPDSPALEDVDHSEKRKKRKTATRSFQAPPAGKRQTEGKNEEGKPILHQHFCRSSSLATVFQVAIEIGASEMPQVDSADAPELDSLELEVLGEDVGMPQNELDEIDLMLLGETSSDPDQTQPPVDEDLRMVIAEALWPELSPVDIRMASAGANPLANKTEF